MGSKYLSSLSKEKKDLLTKKLGEIQNHKCYICQEKINLDLNITNIDHIIPLAKRGKDSEENFALTHESCNKAKQDADLRIARILCKLKKIQEKISREENRAASLKDILLEYGGARKEFKSEQDGKILSYSFGDNKINEQIIFKDKLSGEKTCFIEVPIEYIFHDDRINPRGINSSISKLIKEFYKGNPQLHLSLARIHDNKLKIFDGQHKAVAQILLGIKKLVLRVFIDPEIERLTETNTNAGSVLRQIAFDKSIMSQLNDTLYLERIRKYQKDHKLEESDFSFSEQKLVDYFKGENVNIKKYIVDSIKKNITHSRENKLKDYVDFEGKAKELPISYSAFDKTFLRLFINPKLILETLINYKDDEGLNPRELEINQIIKILNIVAEEIYINKFDSDVGVFRIEKKIINRKDSDITEDHLIAYRISKEEIMFNWIIYLRKVVESYFTSTGKIIDDKKLFQEKFDDQLWQNVRNFIRNLKNLPLWKDKSMASTIFAGKNNYSYWEMIFKTGKNPDGAQILTKPLNFIDMIKPSN